MLRELGINAISSDLNLMMDTQIIDNEMGIKVCAGTVLDVMQNPHDWYWLYDRLDKLSKETLLKIVKLRIMAPFIGMVKAGKILDFEYDYYRTIRETEKNIKKFRKGEVPLYEVCGYKIYGNVGALFEAFVMENYRYRDIVYPREGDVIIDGGSFAGDTTIWFAKFVRSSGKVYAFEPDPENFQLLLKTIELNKMSSIIIPVKAGL